MGMRLSFVTLGVRDLPSLRRFYVDWGWRELPGSDDGWACLDAGGARLALYPMGRLAGEAAPEAGPPPPGRWNGVTLAINVEGREAVEDAYRAALAAGAAAVAVPQPRDWGGHSGYVADPEGNRWEIAWAPGLDPTFVSHA